MPKRGREGKSEGGSLKRIKVQELDLGVGDSILVRGDGQFPFVSTFKMFWGCCEFLKQVEIGWMERNSCLLCL